MKTMYKIEKGVYTDMEGYRTDWTEMVETKWFETKEEALTIGENFNNNRFPNTGDWRVIARTIDEENFTVVDEVVKFFDFWKEKIKNGA